MIVKEGGKDESRDTVSKKQVINFVSNFIQLQFQVCNLMRRVNC